MKSTIDSTCIPGRPVEWFEPALGNPGVPPPYRFLSPSDPGIVVGTCSKCRGPVCVPARVGSLLPPIPTCQQCGAKKKSPYGPVVEME